MPENLFLYEKSQNKSVLISFLSKQGVQNLYVYMIRIFCKIGAKKFFLQMRIKNIMLEGTAF